MPTVVSRLPVNFLPSNAFIDPTGHNAAEIEALLHQVVTLLVEEMSRAEARSPLPEPIPTETLKQWAQIPEQAVEIEVLLERVRSQIRHAMNAAHPGYIGHMDSIPTTLSVIGDWLTAALNNNMLSVEMSPVFSRLEPLVMQQIAARFGLAASAGGVMVSGGSLANLQALTVARNVAFNAINTGVVGLNQQPVFFVSEVAHTSVQKAAMVMGLGAEAAISIRTNANSQMDVDDLKHQLAQTTQRGQVPFAIVATAGTTVTGNIDPIEAIAEIAQSHRLWLHVDAAYGGAIAFSDKYRHLLTGIHHADSVTFNPQKWLYVAKTCATVLFKDIAILKRQFRILAPYMGEDSEWENLGELTIQGTRHADILKLWLSLQHIGSEGYRQIIEHNYTLTAQFVRELQTRKAYLQLASEPQMNLICFRLAPKHTDKSKLDTLNAQLQQYLLRSQRDRPSSIFLSLPSYQQQKWLKAVLLNPFTTHTTITKLFNQIDTFIEDHL
ncbi:MAG: aminotransferase class V-fold PLP-dependent enzyme [Cyanobacteria bacterium P01_D01_bin.105]